MPLGTTVTRIRGDLEIQTADFELGQGLTCGILVEALGATAAELPDPRITQDPHDDWMWWRHLYFVQDAPSAQTGYTCHYELDVRSMRKMEELGQTLWFFASNVSPTISTALGGAWSTLLKLP